MHDDQITKPDDSACGPQAREAINRLIEVVMDGLRHGYFCIAPGSLDTSLSHAAGLSDIAVCHA